MNQKELFNQWKFECEKMKNTINVIQNDFDKLLSDGLCTKQDIENSIKDFQNLLEYNISSFKDLEYQVCELLWEKSR